MGWSAKRISRWLPLLVLLTGFMPAMAQQYHKHPVDSLWWEQKTSGLNYREKKPEMPDGTIQYGGGLPRWINTPAFKYTILFLVVTILLFTLYRLFGRDLLINDAGDKKTAERLLTGTSIDDRFYEMDLERLLRKAVTEQNWVMAVRIRFLMVLKELIGAGLLQWHRDLTNRQISYRIRHREQRQAFNKLVSIYEEAWYGDKPVDEEKYRYALPLFENYPIDKNGHEPE